MKTPNDTTTALNQARADYDLASRIETDAMQKYYTAESKAYAARATARSARADTDRAHALLEQARRDHTNARAAAEQETTR